MTSQDQITALGLIPKPSQCTLLKQSHCDLSLLVAIDYNDESLLGLSSYLNDELARLNIGAIENIVPTFTELNACTSQENAVIVLDLIESGDSEIDYTLRIESTGIRISSAKASGVFYGIQTLLQLFTSHPRSAPALEIYDKARCSYRGLHLDVSRHFRPVSDIKRLIDLMAMHKMNFFHWHLVDDQGWRIEIKKFAKLTEVGSKRTSTVVGHTLDYDAKTDLIPHSGFYSQKEIKDIVAYAEQRYITIIPEIDLPGHSSALLAAYPEYCCANITESPFVKTHFGIFNHVLCNRESSFGFLRDILFEVAQLFPSEYIHIGGDEVKRTHWKQCPDCQSVIQSESLKDTDELQGYFIDQVVDILRSLGKKAICWDDVLESKNLNPDVTIMSWLGEDKAEEALSRGHDLIMTQTNLYFDFYQSMSIDEPFSIHGHASLKNVYNYNPLQHDNNILGAQANIWTEYIKTQDQLEYAILPRMTALAEILWTPIELQYWNDFKERLKVQYERFDKLGFNAARSIYVPEFDLKQNGDNTFNVTILGEYLDTEIHYTLDGTRPNQESTQFLSSLVIDEHCVINACCIEKESGKQHGVNRLTVSPHLALNCNVEYIDLSDSNKSINNLMLLTNGLPQQGQRFQHSNWVLFEDSTEFELVLDLGREIKISNISLGFDGAIGRKLYFPKSVDLRCSLDKKNWLLKGKLSCEEKLGRVETTFKEEVTRYLRIKINNQDQIFSHEDEKMIPTPLYIDEIIVT